jgi:hypothetical protein
LVILFAQIFPSVHLVEAAVNFKVVISLTVTSIFVRLELLAAVILTQVVRIGPLYAALRGPRVLLKAVAFCGAAALRSSVVTCRAAALALANTAADLYHARAWDVVLKNNFFLRLKTFFASTFFYSPQGEYYSPLEIASSATYW